MSASQPAEHGRSRAMPGVSRRALALAGGLLLLLATVGRAVAQDAPGVEIIAVSHDPGGALTVSLFAPDGDTLREQDLVALVDGVPHALELMPAEAAPLSIVIAIETSASMPGPPLQVAQRLALDLIDGLAPDDRVAVVSFGDAAVVVQGFSADGPAPRSAVLGLTTTGLSALHDGVALSSELLGGVDAAGRTLVLLTHGWHFGGVTGRAESFAALAASGAPAYVGRGRAGPRRRPAPGAGRRVGRRVLAGRWRRRRRGGARCGDRGPAGGGRHPLRPPERPAARAGRARPHAARERGRRSRRGHPYVRRHERRPDRRCGGRAGSGRRDALRQHRFPGARRIVDLRCLRGRPGAGGQRRPGGDRPLVVQRGAAGARYRGARGRRDRGYRHHDRRDRAAGAAARDRARRHGTAGDAARHRARAGRPIDARGQPRRGRDRAHGGP